MGVVERIKNFVTDGLENVFTNVGNTEKDKRLQTEWSVDFKDFSTWEAMFQTSDLAKKYINYLPEEMTKMGFEIKTQDHDFIEAIESEMKRLCFEHKATDGFKWGRLYGGALLYFKFNDGLEQNKPLNSSSVSKIDFCHVLTRREVTATPQIVVIDPNSPNYLMPQNYMFNGLQIDTSRVIRFDGKKLPPQLYKENGYWHDSCLSDFYNPCTNYEGANDAMATLMTDLIVPVVKLKNLIEMLEAGKEDLLTARVAQITRYASVLNAVILQDGEEYERKGATTTGLPELLDKLKERLVTASGMPHTIFLGSGPDGGLNASGNSEMRDWYSFVKQQQEEHYLPVIQKFIEYILMQKGFEKFQSTDYEIEFCPLYQESQKEKLESRKIQAEIDEIYIQNTVYTPEEVAASRFSDGDFSYDTVLDEPLRSSSEKPVEVPSDYQAARGGEYQDKK